MPHKKALVAGGAGFIGSHVCRTLLAQGWQVVCLDNFSTGSRDAVTDLANQPGFEILEHDVATALRIDGIDRIYNFACPASPPKYQQDPITTAKTNCFGTFNLLELAKNTGAAMLQASTSEIYGDPLTNPQAESYFGNVNPIGVRSCYDEGKRLAETVCMDFFRQHGTAVKIIRIFNTYGPGMAAADGRVITNFIMAALTHQPLKVYGDGSQTRSFQYIDDLLPAIDRLMNTEPQFTGPINIGNPEEYTVQQLAELILKLIPASRSGIEYHPLPPDDPRQRQPDISVAKQRLGWKPKIPLREGLVKTIAYFKQLL